MQLFMSPLAEEGNITEVDIHSGCPFSKRLNMLSMGTWRHLEENKCDMKCWFPMPFCDIRNSDCLLFPFLKIKNIPCVAWQAGASISIYKQADRIYLAEMLSLSSINININLSGTHRIQCPVAVCNPVIPSCYLERYFSEHLT